jgi:hypothetical protein
VKDTLIPGYRQRWVHPILTTPVSGGTLLESAAGAKENRTESWCRSKLALLLSSNGEVTTMSEAWKRASGRSDDGDDLPGFGRKARAWFKRMVRAMLSDVGASYRYRMHDGELEPLVERFAADPMAYVEWVDADEYRGRGWSSGAWKINWDKVKADVSPVLEQMREAKDTDCIKSLDDWLRADLADAFEYPGAEGGTDNLPKKLRRELRAAARVRRRRLPKTCTTCPALFEPRSNRQRRCPKCIEAGITEESLLPGARRKSPQ